MLRPLLYLCRWIAALVVADGLSAILCVAISIAFASTVGGTVGFFAAVATITVLFSALGFGITSMYYQEPFTQLHKLSNWIVCQITLPLSSGRVKTLIQRGVFRNNLVDVGIYLASSIWLGGIITMVFRTEARGGNREKFFWALLLGSSTVYALRLGIIYAGAGWGAVWLIGRLF